uniref:Golgin subfamily A member 7 n=1 Tax=Homo sapiens TaxID=9606 RepID=A0A8Q3WLM5_HUMAN
MRPQQAPVSGKVFIQRDYSSGTRCQFQTKFPAELENRIDRQQFEETVRTLNNLYAEAEKLGGQSYLEGCLACLTAYTIFLCMETHYEKVMLHLFSQKSLKIMKKVLKKVSKYIQEQNEKIYAPQGLLLTDPIERGLRVIEITIYEDRGMSSGR